MFQPENSFVFRKSTGRRGNSVGSTCHETKALCQTTDLKRSHEPRLYSRILIQVSKDGWHLVEALGSATSSISQCELGRPSFEKLQTSDVPLPGWIFLRFSPAIWGLLYSQNYSNSFRNFRSVFYQILIIICIYYHLGQSRRQFTLGTLLMQKWKCCPLSQKG